MLLREKITEAMLDFSPIPQDKADGQRRFYYTSFEDNLFCPLGESALKAYSTGSGDEIRQTVKTINGKQVIIPPKMASIASSSAMTFNLIGNDPITAVKNTVMPRGTYEVQYEKKMHTIQKGNSPANIDACLINNASRVAVFCEMKMLEFLDSPSSLKDSYLEEKYYFTPDYSILDNPMDAYKVFGQVMEKLIDKSKKEESGYCSVFKRFDAWQMLKHILAIYNYTSFSTKSALESFNKSTSLAGKYDNIILANVVNEYPQKRIKDPQVKEEYTNALQEERDEAALFIDIIKNSDIPFLFKNNCNVNLEVKYVTTKEFADSIDMSEDRLKYLTRYFVPKKPKPDILEPKKLALIRIWQILHKHSDYDHPLTQDDIANYLEKDYGIIIERKAIGRNISLLKEAGAEIESRRSGSYLESREFEDSELKLLIDGVLCSQHINSRYSSDLIEKLCGLSNKYFLSRVKNIHTVQEWNKTENKSLFYNIEMVDIAIEEGRQLQYEYNKYGLDKQLHKSSYQKVTPYQLILHNQKYYLMAHSTYWDHMVFHRLDRISNMQFYDMPAKPIREVHGYEGGIDYKKLSSAMPYMYTDEPERIRFTVSVNIIDQVIDWFGKDISISKAENENEVIISLFASPTAMEFWAMQYMNNVEIISPPALRKKILNNINSAQKKYEKNL